MSYFKLYIYILDYHISTPSMSLHVAPWSQEGLRESNNLRFEELRETNAELSSLQATATTAVSGASGPVANRRTVETQLGTLGNDVDQYYVDRFFDDFI